MYGEPPRLDVPSVHPHASSHGNMWTGFGHGSELPGCKSRAFGKHDKEKSKKNVKRNEKLF